MRFIENLCNGIVRTKSGQSLDQDRLWTKTGQIEDLGQNMDKTNYRQDKDKVCTRQTLDKLWTRSRQTLDKARLVAHGPRPAHGPHIFHSSLQ